jgi:hypothetical protein
VKAWRTELFGVVCLVAAETRGQALSATVRAAREAGYHEADLWTRTRVTRAKHRDGWAQTAKARRCFDILDPPESEE